MSGISELRECDEASVSVEGDTDVLLEEEDEEEEDETTSNKELLERLRELEAENTSLALANESQREAYERCLDEVANHVVQALLNQKDLREECIKLKMRVFDLERQNRTLTDFLTHKLHFSSSPLHQLSSVSCTDHRSDPSLVIVELPRASTSQGKVKDSEECAQNITESSAQASSSSMEAMSPFLKKKAHILEVLRKLEESDPLKFPPSSCYHHHHPHTEPHLPGEVTVTSMVHLSPHQHQCRQSSSDSDLHEHTHAIGDGQQDSHASLNFGGCPSCLILQQRSSMELLKGTKGSSVPTGSGKDDKRGQMWLEECGASGQTIDKTNHPCSEDPKNDCNKRQLSKISPTKTKSTNKFHQEKKSETIPSPKGGKMKQSLKKPAPCEKQEPDICNGELTAAKETPVSKKASVASSYSSTSLPERSTSAFLQQQVTEKKSPQSPASLFGESKPSAPTLMKLLKIPSASENMAASNAFRLSPQLTRNSKIPCRNNYEVQTRKANTAEQASSSKPDSHPETHSAPTSPPNHEETSSIPKKDPGFSSHSAPKSSKVSKAGAQVPHYENIDGPSTFNATTATKDTTELSEKQKLNWRDEKVLNPLSSDSSTSSSDSSSSSSDQETDTESPVWQRPQHHFSLPTSSSSANKAQRMSYPSMKDGYHNQLPPVASPKVGASGASQIVVKRRDRQPLVPDRREISSYSEMSYHPFKERLAVLGRLQNLEDMHQAGVKRGAQSNVSRPAASTGKGERSKTAERQIERITLEQRKHTGSFEGKSYPKNNFGNYAKVHASSAAAAERKYITKPDSQKTRTVMPSTASCETLVVMRSYGKCPSPLNKTVPSPQSSPSRAQSKSPSKAGNSSYPRGMKPVQEEHLNLQKHQSPKLTTRKKKAITQVDTFPPPVPSKSTLDSAKSVEEKRLSVPQSSIEQKVMRGIQENMLKLQEQDRGPAVETKQKASNGIASWFGLKKSKLPALNRKAELSKIKLNTSSSSTSSGTKDISGTKGGSRKVVESLNISKLMEKAEDLRKALEDERVYVKGVGIPLDRSVRGRSCEVIVDQTQGQLSLMYTGVTGDGFMQQLLNRVDDRGAPSFGIMHRRLSFDSKRSRPVFGHQQSCVRQTRSGEEIKCSELSRGDDMTSDESLAESVSSQHFKGSMRTLDSGIGTFPLPDYANNAAGKLNPKLQSSSVSHQMAMKSRKTRTLEGGLASLDEVNTSVLYTSSLEAKGTSVHLSSTIHEDVDVCGGHFQAPPTADWEFPKLRASEGQIEPPSKQTPTKRSLDKVPLVPRDVEPKNVSPSGGRRGKSRSHGAQDTTGKDGTANLMKDRSEELLSPNRPETVESLSDSLYDSLSSCGSQG